MQISINPIRKTSQPMFRSNNVNYIKLEGEAYKQARSLKNIFREIFSQFSYNESLMELSKRAFNNIKLTSNSVKFLLPENESIHLSMPRGLDGSLFSLQTLKDDKPTHTVIFDAYYNLIESFFLIGERFLSPENYNKELTDKTIDTVFKNADYPLLKLRIFLKKESGTFSSYRMNIPKVKKEIQNSKQEKKDEIVIPPKDKWLEYSMAEVIRQNANKKSVINNTNKMHSKSNNKRVKTKALGVIRVDAGIVDNDLRTKISEIKNLSKEIKSFLEDKSPSTIAKILTSYPKLRRNDKKGLTFNYIKVLFPQSKVEQNENIIKIKDLDRSYNLYLTESGKILDYNEEKINLVRFFENPKYLNQKEVDTKINDQYFKNLIYKTLTELQEFKSFIDNQGWRIRKDKKILEQNYGYIKDELKEKINTIYSKYNNIKSIFDSMSYYNASKVKSSYGKILTAVPSRLEFINPLNDGMNVAFDFTKNKYGDFYKIAKHSGKQELEEIFLVSTDGKIVKNVVKNQGLKSPFPTGGMADLKYFSQEELKEVDLENLNSILDILLEKTNEYEKFVLDYMDKTNVANSIKKEKKSQRKLFKIEEIQSFFEKTLNDIQISVNELKETKDLKQAFNNLTEDLKSKFDDFLKPNKK